jgi:hypothetical protein
MADGWADGMISPPLERAGDGEAYAEGYRRAARELTWVRAHGWRPTERQVTVALMQAVRVYAAARGGKFVGGQHPEWLHGRADALRDALREDKASETEQ